MFFTIIASCNFTEIYRLKKNGEWGRIEDLQVSYDDDMVFETYGQAELWLERNPVVNIKNVEVETNPNVVELFSDKNYDFEITIHRTTRPKHLFTKEELKEVILNGDDTKVNCLVIDFDGYLKLTRPLPNKTPLTLKGYAVRFETFQPHNNYVGSTTDLSDLDNFYTTLLSEWLDHLKTGQTMYTDVLHSDYTEDELIDLIHNEMKKYGN